jgi:hypothetical protein
MWAQYRIHPLSPSLHSAVCTFLYLLHLQADVLPHPCVIPQYLESNADVATSCYRAGHSLYFNPSLDLQASLLKTLAKDLGMGFGASLDGGMGGDVELFAVAGRHLTPW